MGAIRKTARLLAGSALAISTALTIAPTPANAATTPYCNTTLISGFITVPFYNSATFGTVFCTMKVGSQGPQVRQLQRTLNRCYRQTLLVDGSYGWKTWAAVVAAQRAERMTDADGIYGPNTAATIKHEALRQLSCERM